MAVASFNVCPLLGPIYPPPTSLLSAPAIQVALSNITVALDNLVATDNSSSGTYPADSTAFSIGIFSTTDNSSDPFWQYHYTSPQVANSTEGVNKVDENSVYRVGSITKLFSTYAFLVEAGDGYWEEPIIKYIPELAAAVQGDPEEGIEDIERFRWQDITMGELAGQTSGIGRDYATDYAFLSPEDAISAGLPPLNSSEIPVCSLTNLCNRQDFFKWFLQTKIPTLIPGQTPAYSNEAWQFFGYAVQGITNKTLSQIISERIYKPLNMSQSSFSQPPSPSVGVLPRSANASGWTLVAGDEAPAGYMFSSLHDMTTAGRSILSSSLLPPAQTRRWLQPRSHTSSPTGSVGLPWEIQRGPVAPTIPRITDAYTKAGNLGDWGALLVLLPDWEVGFTFLGAAVGGVAPGVFADIVGGFIMPALEDTARGQAGGKYGGVYEAMGDGGLNSSLELTTEEIAPGLDVGVNVVKWVSNGTVLLGEVGAGSEVAAQIYPAGLRSEGNGNGTVRTAWNFVETVANGVGAGSRGFFTQECNSWEGVNSLDYGNLPVDEMVFEEDVATGKVLAVEIPGLRVRMGKVG